MTPDEIIGALKAKFGVATDTDLALILAVDKRTVAAWRARGAVPQRYRDIVQGADHAAAMTPPQRWGDYENHAFGLALFRFTRARSDVAQQAIAGSIFAKFRTHATFWLLMHRAQKDLSALMEESGADLSSALALAIHNDLMAGSGAVERDRDLLDMTMKGSRQGAEVPHL